MRQALTQKLFFEFERTKMTLIESIYTSLQEHALVETAEDFSTEWCWRSKSWYAVQKNSHADFSIPVAINCLNSVKIKLGFKHMMRKGLGSFVDDDIDVLNNVRAQLEAYLLEKHRITEVADKPKQCGKAAP